jgi:hypothetical protein
MEQQAMTETIKKIDMRPLSGFFQTIIRSIPAAVPHKNSEAKKLAIISRGGK